MMDRLIRITTALAVVAVAVAVVAAVISYQHAFELVRSHGESGVTARLLPFTVDGLIWAASMVVLDASRRGQPVPRLAAWSLGFGIVARLAPTWRTGWGTGLSVPWSARGPRWRWLAPSSFLRGSSECRVAWRCSVLRRAFATHLAGAALVIAADQKPRLRGPAAQIGSFWPQRSLTRFA